MLHHITGMIKKCFKARVAAMDKGDNWIPNCDKTGQYAPEQCDETKSKYSTNLYSQITGE